MRRAAAGLHEDWLPSVRFSDTVIPDDPRQPRVKDGLKKMELVRQVS
jgi:hypothetical protein